VRRAGAVAVAVALALAGCGGDDEIYGPEARTAADNFVRALVSTGNPELAEKHAVGAARKDLSLWHEFLMRDGVQTVEGPGSVRANCVKPFPVFAPSGASNCIVYRLVGLTPMGTSPRTLVTTARFRVWLSESDGRWRVSDFDYTPHLETR
jgi:hypothetical protein